MQDKRPSYCLHGLNEKIIDMIKEFPMNSLVFFDDGLASLYKYKDFLKEYSDKTKVQFITAVNPWVVLQADKCSEREKIKLDYVKCDVAHNTIAINQKFYYYLTSKMIKDLFFNYGVEIADHSWNHFLFEKRTKGLKAKTVYYKEIINKCKSFYDGINIYPTKYVRPYNRENILYEVLVSKILNIKNIYGGERINGEWNSYFKKK